MATLKGQNLRIISGTSVIAMATSCTITLTGNSDDASTKDDVGMASKPEITSKGWSVQVESLSVADVGAMLTAIKSLTPFSLEWDETALQNGQLAPVGAAFARGGQAYLNDVTFNFNDRENSSKSLQFTGCSPLAEVTTPTITPVTPGSYTKGQFVRLFLSANNTDAPTAVLAAAKSLSLHVSMQLEDATTKDTTGDWQVQEPTGLSYDISTSALVRSGDTITSSVAGKDLADLTSIFEASTPVKWLIANVSGDNNRTKGATIASGSATITQLTINAANKQNATYDTQLSGYGIYTVGA